MGHRPQTHDVLSTRRVVILDEPPLIVQGVMGMLGPYAPAIRVRPAESRADPRSPVHVTLYDPARAPSGSDRLGALLGDPVHGQLVAYSFRPSWTRVSEWLTLGCAGVVDKGGSTTDLVQVITSLRRGGAAGEGPHGWRPLDRQPDAWPGKEHGLSWRESEMIRLITAGLTNEVISVRVGLSINTVKTYIRSAYRKLDVARRPEAVRWGLEHGMLGAPASR
jgi:DNA-binding NarL/FixJ family response regulator